MSILNSATRLAIIAAIKSGNSLNAALAEQFQGTTVKERDTILFSAAQLVAETYTSHRKCSVQVEAYASRKGNSIAFGALMDDGSHDTKDKVAEAARKFFTRFILKAGFITVNKATAKSKEADIESSAKRAIGRYTKSQLRAYIKLLQEAL